MLCAHLDVVPVNRDSWEEDPFGANIKDGFIYARGTIDVKQIVMVCLFNVEICEFWLIIYIYSSKASLFTAGHGVYQVD